MKTTAIYDIFVSIIVPVRNMATRVEKTLIELDQEAKRLFSSYEIILVDDASADETVKVIGELQQRIENIQLFCLDRASGYDVAVVAGLDSSIGDVIAILNLESDPLSLLADMWAELQKGHELVCGVRKDRLRFGFRAFLNRKFYQLFNSLTGLRVPSGVASPRMFNRKVASYISLSNDRHLMIKVLPFFSSYRSGAVEYIAVENGVSFGEQSLLTATFTGITILLGSSNRPLRLFTAMSIISSAMSLLYVIYVLAVSIFNRHVVQGWMSLALPAAVISFFLSSLLGIISEYVFLLVRQGGSRPPYMIVKESTSSVLDIRKRLNVVEESGQFAQNKE